MRIVTAGSARTAVGFVKGTLERTGRIVVQEGTLDLVVAVVSAVVKRRIVERLLVRWKVTIVASSSLVSHDGVCERGKEEM